MHKIFLHILKTSIVIDPWLQVVYGPKRQRQYQNKDINKTIFYCSIYFSVLIRYQKGCTRNGWPTGKSPYDITVMQGLLYLLLLCHATIIVMLQVMHIHYNHAMPLGLVCSIFRQQLFALPKIDL